MWASGIEATSQVVIISPIGKGELINVVVAAANEDADGVVVIVD